MNQQVKNLLKRLKVYYPMQGFYRSTITAIKQIRLRIKYARYRGDGYTCNYCDFSYSKFVPWHPDGVDEKALNQNNVVAGYGENVLCPNCLSMPRERLLKAYVGDKIDINQKTILHISPEKEFYKFLKEKAHVVTVDYEPDFYRNIDPEIAFADATKLSFENDSFDLVIGNHIMEHIPDDSKAMSEIYRVLKPGGIAILQVPFSETLPATIEEPRISNGARQSALFGQHDHVRIYALQDYIDRLRKAGFAVEYIVYESLQSYYRYAIQENEGFVSIVK